jgi:hypothetical protein
MIGGQDNFGSMIVAPLWATETESHYASDPVADLIPERRVASRLFQYYFALGA